MWCNRCMGSTHYSPIKRRKKNTSPKNSPRDVILSLTIEQSFQSVAEPKVISNKRMWNALRFLSLPNHCMDGYCWLSLTAIHRESIMSSSAHDPITIKVKQFSITSGRLLTLCRDRKFSTETEPNSFFEELPISRIRWIYWLTGKLVNVVSRH